MRLITFCVVITFCILRFHIYNNLTLIFGKINNPTNLIFKWNPTYNARHIIASTLFIIRKYHRIDLFQNCIDKWRYSVNRRHKDETCNKGFMLFALKLCVDYQQL